MATLALLETAAGVRMCVRCGLKVAPTDPASAQTWTAALIHTAGQHGLGCGDRLAFLA